MSNPYRDPGWTQETSSAPVNSGVPREHSVPAPFPPMRLSRTTRAALIGLRLFMCLITAMAIVTFLHNNPH
jgi:hypothetical protein